MFACLYVWLFCFWRAWLFPPPPPPPCSHYPSTGCFVFKALYIHCCCLFDCPVSLLILTDYVPESGKNVKSTKYASPYHVCVYGIGVATFFGGGGGWWSGYESVNAYLYLRFHKTPRMEFVLISQLNTVEPLIRATSDLRTPL